MTEASPHTLKPLEDEPKLEAVIEAISSLTADDVLIGSTADALDELSTRTTFEGIEANPDGVFTSDGGATFQAACTIYVTLNYGGRRDDVSMADSYPATVHGTIDAEGVVAVDHVDVDTSSFFGPEE
jgi:hypothetical protein